MIFAAEWIKNSRGKVFKITATNFITQVLLSYSEDDRGSIYGIERRIKLYVVDMRLEANIITNNFQIFSVRRFLAEAL